MLPLVMVWTFALCVCCAMVLCMFLALCCLEKVKLILLVPKSYFKASKVCERSISFGDGMEEMLQLLYTHLKYCLTKYFLRDWTRVRAKGFILMI